MSKNWLMNLNLPYVDRRWDVGFLSKGRYSTRILIVGGLVLVFTASTLFKWLRMRSYFKRLNVKGPTPLPIVGNLMAVMSQGFNVYDEMIHRTYGDVCGYFEGTLPVLLVTDPKMIKAITVKDSAYFYNRRIIDGLLIEPIKSFLPMMQNEEWKNTRSILSTSFTSAKLKDMSKLMMKCSEAVCSHLAKMADDGNAEFDVKKIFGSLTLDVISSCLFGIETNSIEDPDNRFLKNIKDFFVDFSPKMAFLRNQIIKFVLFPKTTKRLADRGWFSLIPKESTDYIVNLSRQIIERRRAKLEVRLDFIQNMVDHETQIDEEEQHQQQQSQSRKLSKKLSDKEILSQAIFFFAAGYDTTASTLTMIAYNLAMNPDCQTKVIDELDEVLRNNGGKINYETVAELKYLDQCIDETLRMYPAAFRSDRVCNQDYEYDNNGVVIRIPKGQVVNICIWAVHHDPEIYPEPERFDPERFSEEAKRTRGPEYFIPFGSGQHMCIGQRFALIEVKLFLAEFFSKMYFTVCDKTPKKLTLAGSGLLKTNETIYLKAKKRF